MPTTPNLDAQVDGPQYLGPATFLKTRSLSEPEELDEWRPDVAIVGAPWDDSTTYRPGARFGPRAVRVANYQPPSWHLDLEVAPFEVLKVVDYGDAVCYPGLTDQAHEAIRTRVAEVASRKIVPMVIGGDHSISLPILRGIASRGPVGMVHIDAHCDTGDDYLGSKFHHGAPFRRAVEEGLLDPKRTIQIGIRGGQNFMDGIEFSKSHGMRVVFIEEFAELGVDRVIEEARRVVGDGRTYISFDVDGLDPVYAPGTGTPEIGGLTTLEAQRLLRGLRGLNLIGGDVVEVAPPYDQTGNTALVGATIMFEILCLIADRNFGARAGGSGQPAGKR